MNVYEDHDNFTESKQKIIRFIKNGNPLQKPFELVLQKNLNMHTIQHILEHKSEIKGIQNMRLFRTDGVEIFDDDIPYLNDKIVLYVSNGEEFDQNSSFSEYELVKTLGEGGFGQVLLGIHKITQQKVAIKILKTNVIENAKDIDMVFREAEIVKSLNHKNIVKIKNCYTLQDMKVAIVMEYLEGGELLQRVEQKGYFQEEEAKIYFRQLVSGVGYCHQNNLIHRDLKLENLLLTTLESNQIKIVDFGIAGVVSKNSQDNIDCGSLKYMPPEVLGGLVKNISASIDIWAMGVILYGMLFGKFPFDGANHQIIIQKIIQGKYEFPKERVNNISEECLNLIDQMLQIDPQQRITTAKLLAHPWVQEDNLLAKYLSNDNSPKNLQMQNQQQQEQQKQNNIKQNGIKLNFKPQSLQNLEEIKGPKSNPQKSQIDNVIGSSNQFSQSISPRKTIKTNTNFKPTGLSAITNQSRPSNFKGTSIYNQTFTSTKIKK